jgi:hypothetical protein
LIKNLTMYINRKKKSETFEVRDERNKRCVKANCEPKNCSLGWQIYDPRN